MLLPPEIAQEVLQVFTDIIPILFVKTFILRVCNLKDNNCTIEDSKINLVFINKVSVLWTRNYIIHECMYQLLRVTLMLIIIPCNIFVIKVDSKD